jgi:hypothetical protein
MVCDFRQDVGSKVHAKALHVTNKAECSRRYGAGKKNKLVEGTALEAKEVQKTGNSRMSWFITADYNLGGGDIKRAELNIRSVKLGKHPSELPVALPGPPTLPIPPPAPLIHSPTVLVPPIDPGQGDQVNNDRPEIKAVEDLIAELEELLPPPLPLTPPAPAHLPTTIAHETSWYKDLEAC